MSAALCPVVSVYFFHVTMVTLTMCKQTKCIISIINQQCFHVLDAGVRRMGAVQLCINDGLANVRGDCQEFMLYDVNVLIFFVISKNLSVGFTYSLSSYDV